MAAAVMNESLSAFSSEAQTHDEPIVHRPRNASNKRCKGPVIAAPKEESKKAPMRPAEDVIDRIMHDSAIPQHLFFVGYEDRFIGIVEKAVTAFNWASYASTTAEVAIPRHRIVYIKYRDEIVWDRRARLDNVFGSAGGLRIHDVIAKYDETHGPAPAADGGNDA